MIFNFSWNYYIQNKTSVCSTDFFFWWGAVGVKSTAWGCGELGQTCGFLNVFSGPSKGLKPSWTIQHLINDGIYNGLYDIWVTTWTILILPPLIHHYMRLYDLISSGNDDNPLWEILLINQYSINGWLPFAAYFQSRDLLHIRASWSCCCSHICWI